MGIEILYPTDDETQQTARSKITLDVIALHGLNGSQTKTWTSPKTQKLWLRDFLPADIPKARIMTFGYDATAAFTSSTAGIVEHARDLLISLAEKRVDSEEVRRPLIFIGHSLGGLVIKQALIIAETEARYKKIYTSTNGIVFFGTPHQGSSLANLASTILRIPSLLALKPSSELLESLREGCPRLVELTQKFKIHHEARPYEIVSFYETRKLTGMKNLVVTKQSALLTPPEEIPVFEEQIPVSADHREMCRFASKKEKTYNSAVRCIRRIHRDALAADVKNEHFIVPATVNPHFTGRNEILERMRESLIEDRCIGPRYQERFVLYGLGGSGKTQMCLKFAQDHQQSFWGIFWIDATSKETAEESFRKIGCATKQEEGIQSVKAWLTGKHHWLLILDNADDPDLEVSQFFPEGIQGTILITTRNPDLQFWGTGGCRVDEMEPDDAAELLLKSANLGSRNANEQQTMALEVAKTLGYFALAIVQAGAVIRRGLCSVDGFCELYSKQKGNLLESGRQDSNTEYHYSVYTTWEISLSKIATSSSLESRMALELLKLFAFMHFEQIQEIIFETAFKNYQRGPRSSSLIFSGSIFVQMMPNGWDEVLMAQALRLLVGFSLIHIDKSKQISIHPLVHDWCQERLSEKERDKAWEMAFATLGMSANCGDSITENQHRKILLCHIDRCLAKKSGALFSEGPYREDRLQIGRQINRIYREAHHWEQALNLSILDLQMQDIHPESPWQRLQTIDRVGECLFNLNRAVESLEAYELQTSLATEINDPGSIIRGRIGLALNYNRFHEYNKAIDIMDKTLKQYETIMGGSHQHILHAKETLAWSHKNLGNTTLAIQYAEEIFHQSKLLYGQEHVVTIVAGNNLAGNYADLKKFKQARALLEKTLAQFEETVGPDHAMTVRAACNLVDLSRKENRNPAIRWKTAKERAEVLNRCRNVFGSTHPDTLTCLELLVEDHFLSGAFTKARKLQQDLIKLNIERWGTEHEITIRAIDYLKFMDRFIAARHALYWWLPKRILR